MTKLVNGLDLSKLQKEAAFVANNGQGHAMLLAVVVEGLCQILQTLVSEEVTSEEPLIDKIYKKTGKRTKALQAFIDAECVKNYGRPITHAEVVAGFTVALEDQMMGNLWVNDVLDEAADYTRAMARGEIDLSGEAISNG